MRLLAWEPEVVDDGDGFLVNIFFYRRSSGAEIGMYDPLRGRWGSILFFSINM